MTVVYQIDPLQDPRWTQFLERHPSASIFHTPGWLESLRRAYRYRPFALTTCPPGAELTNGIALCRVDSWLTGSRLVSGAFADHCEPLAADAAERDTLLAALPSFVASQHCRYLELRPLAAAILETTPPFGKSQSFCFHRIDLRPDLDTLFGRLHKSCIQRKIRKAEREQLAYECGTSDELLRKFYALMELTRREHGVPPQPFAWFRHLRDCLRDGMEVRILSRDGQPAAGMVTLFYKQTLVYKYGASDARFNQLGGMPLLFWHAIQDGKARGAVELDLGRSDRDNSGLIAFKGHLGGTASTLDYYRFPRPAPGQLALQPPAVLVKLWRYLPPLLCRAAGTLLYRHIG